MADHRWHGGGPNDPGDDSAQTTHLLGQLPASYGSGGSYQGTASNGGATSLDGSAEDSASVLAVNVNGLPHDKDAIPLFPTASAMPANQGESLLNRQKTKRLVCLDALRGVAILGMVFVNAAEFTGPLAWIGHSQWNGLHFADFVMPLFLVSMGAALSVKYVARTRTRTAASVAKHVGIRTLSLCLWGIFIKNWDGGKPMELHTLRLPSVLGRLGITYFVVAMLILLLPRRIPAQLQQTSLVRALPEVAEFFWLWVVTLAVLIVYLCVVFGLDVPGCGRGYLGPGGLDKGGRFFNCTGGATGYVDRVVFTPNHLMDHGQPAAPCRALKCHSYDPMGLLGVIPSVLQTLLGFTSGRVLKTQAPERRIRRLVLWAVILGGIGAVLAVSRAVPICKPLWSVSYVSVTTAVAFVLLALLHAVTEAPYRWRGGILAIVGKNSLALYIFSELCVRPLLNSFSHHGKTLYTVVYQEFFDNADYFHSRNLGNAVWGTLNVLLVVLFGYYLHRKNKIFKL
eukprot:m.5838 g.5838  ORF g.5838 m.5838 type:complete len:511 (-) comp2480_c0_seq2:61-1593(-)